MVGQDGRRVRDWSHGLPPAASSKPKWEWESFAKGISDSFQSFRGVGGEKRGPPESRKVIC